MIDDICATTGGSLSLSGAYFFLYVVAFDNKNQSLHLCYGFCSMQFIEKAPEDVVRGVQEKAAEAEEKINLTKNRLAFLQSTVLVTK